MQTSTPVNQASTQPNFTPSPAQPVNSAPPLTPIQQMGAPPANLTPFHPGVPITSPLPSAAMSPAAMALPPAILDSHDSVTADDDAPRPPDGDPLASGQRKRYLASILTSTRNNENH